MIRFTTTIYLFLFLGCNGQTDKIKDNTSSSKMKNVTVYDNLFIKDSVAKDYFIKGLDAINLNASNEAKKYFLKAYEIESDNPIILNGLANVINQLGERGEAENLYLRAISIDSNYIVSYVNYGNYLRQLHRFDKAKETLLEGFKFDPSNQEKTGLYYNLALVNVNLDKCAEALECAKKAESSTSNHAEKEEMIHFVQEIEELCKN